MEGLADIHGDALLASARGELNFVAAAPAPSQHSSVPAQRYILRATSFMRSSEIASPGLSPFGHALAQLRMVWQR
jgi:hypothetical protein